jgi:hypothetical protein
MDILSLTITMRQVENLVGDKHKLLPVLTHAIVVLIEIYRSRSICGVSEALKGDLSPAIRG